MRTAADRAVDALGEAEKKVKGSWSDDLKLAYRELEAEQAAAENPRARQRFEKAKQEAKDIDPRLKQEVRKIKQALDDAETARLDAEDTFAKAELQLSASGARLGAEKAVHAWDLRLKAIRKAEALGKKQGDGQAGS